MCNISNIYRLVFKEFSLLLLFQKIAYLGCMKTKPILIVAVSVIILTVSGYFIFRGKSKPSTSRNEISNFLKAFKAQVIKGNRDSLMSYFADKQASEPINKLITTLINKQQKSGEEDVSFNIELNVEQAEITQINPQIATAVVPVTFSEQHLDTRHSGITFTIQKNEQNKLSIYQADARNFMSDYIAYRNTAWEKKYTDKEIYSPETLKAFLDAGNLFAKYDSVIWFTHLKKQTYFYVVKGKWDYYNLMKDTAKIYKMGLIGPDYKEVIPTEYDLIHNISGTFPDLIEVEKDRKRGFYDLSGKVVIPVEYDQIFPVNDTENLAALRKGDEYFWLKNDFSVSEKAEVKISELFSKLKQPNSFTLTKSPAGDITEFNSREQHGSIYIPPSYLVDLGLIRKIQEFKNPLRNHVDFVATSSQYIVKAKALPVKISTENNSWLQSAYYSIRDYFIGGRSEFYDTNNMVLIDNKNNKIYSYEINTDINSEEGGSELSGSCNEYNINAISDSLLEVKVTTTANIELYNNTFIDELPIFHLLKIENGKVKEAMNTKRVFAFTKYQKIDDHFINGCYVYGKLDNGKYKTSVGRPISSEVLRYMKNEIYADYNYKFKDKRWTDIFTQQFYDRYKPENTSVQDSLTDIDKYNIQWIDQKLKGLPAIKPNVLAAK